MYPLERPKSIRYQHTAGPSGISGASNSLARANRLFVPVTFDDNGKRRENFLGALAASPAPTLTTSSTQRRSSQANVPAQQALPVWPPTGQAAQIGQSLASSFSPSLPAPLGRTKVTRTASGSTPAEVAVNRLRFEHLGHCPNRGQPGDIWVCGRQAWLFCNHCLAQSDSTAF